MNHRGMKRSNLVLIATPSTSQACGVRSGGMKRSNLSRIAAVALVLATVLLLGRPAPAAPPQRFSTPDAAVRALVVAARANDQKALLVILGSDATDIVSSGDPVADANARADFLKHVGERCDLVKASPTSFMLSVGSDRWPFAIPIVYDGKRWSFDTKVGRQELLNRRVGKNELATIDTLHMFVDAQREYYSTNQPPAYARYILSSPGKRDGLYWPVAAGQAPSPVGPTVADALREGYKAVRGQAYHGYLYRILTAQGKNASGGARSYEKDGRMSGGFAIVAWPVKYGVSGVMTFMVDPHGIVYQKNLGKSTGSLAKSITEFDPDTSWMPVPVVPY